MPAGCVLQLSVPVLGRSALISRTCSSTSDSLQSAAKILLNGLFTPNIQYAH